LDFFTSPVEINKFSAFWSGKNFLTPFVSGEPTLHAGTANRVQNETGPSEIAFHCGKSPCFLAKAQSVKASLN
jgi:hypothetical protein